MRFARRSALVAAAVWALAGCSSTAGAFCDATGRGASAQAAIGSYLRACGGDYRIATGPFDGDKATSSYSRYARLLEYTLKVKHNDEGSIAFVEVGQRTIGGWWTTLGRPGTGP